MRRRFRAGRYAGWPSGPRPTGRRGADIKEPPACGRTFRQRWARTWRVGRTFLAGDAAHLMPPFMGQGLCAGLRDARALAWRLGLVQAGLAGTSELENYGRERAGHVREIIDAAVASGRVICLLDPARSPPTTPRCASRCSTPSDHRTPASPSGPVLAHRPQPGHRGSAGPSGADRCRRPDRAVRRRRRRGPAAGQLRGRPRSDRPRQRRQARPLHRRRTGLLPAATGQSQQLSLGPRPSVEAHRAG